MGGNVGITPATMSGPSMWVRLRENSRGACSTEKRWGGGFIIVVVNIITTMIAALENHIHPVRYPRLLVREREREREGPSFGGTI